jgi:hypothetical protein
MEIVNGWRVWEGEGEWCVAEITQDGDYVDGTHTFKSRSHARIFAATTRVPSHFHAMIDLPTTCPN